jgi:hypothetical protein
MKGQAGQLCAVAPVDPATLSVGDIVMCKIGGNEFLHIVKAIDRARFQIRNNGGFINGWLEPSAVYGKCVRVDP